VVYGAIVFGFCELLLVFMPTYEAYSLALPFCGFAALTTLITANSLVQINTDPVLRGRVMGIYLLVFLGGTPIGSPLIGYMAEKFGVRQTVGTCASITILAAVFVWTRYRNRVGVPKDFSIDVVLPPTYDNKG